MLMSSVSQRLLNTCKSSFKADTGDERNMTSRKINIVEVGPRDGLQSEPEILSTASKVEFITRAVDAGVTRLEVASFVHPKKVPQMADAEALLAELPLLDDVSYIGLVMNERGLDRALATPVHEIGMVVVATDTYNQRNQGVLTDESIDAWLKIASRAKANGKIANIMISSAFGCPFEGEVSPDRIVDIAKKVMEAGPAELGIADSIGVAVPNQVSELLGMLKEALGAIPLRCHLHNTRNTGLANAQAAIDAGAISIDASIGGIGGCPFAPAATGNIPTDDLLYMLNRSGIETSVSLEKIITASKWLEQELGRSVPAMLPKAGIFPPAG
jgi:hydroxymethylglutaryl-CoA lyase